MNALANSVCEPLIDAKEAGRILGVHPQTVRRLAAKGELPGRRIGTVWRFRRSVLDEWIDGDVHSSGHLRSETKGAEK